MARDTTDLFEARPPIATGWLLGLTWFFVAVFAIGLVGSALILLIGPETIEATLGVPARMPAITLWWALQQAAFALFAVACIGVLMRKRRWAFVALIAAWIMVAIQSIEAALQLLDLRISIPFGAILYLAFALKMAKVLRSRDAKATISLPESGGLV